MSLPLSVRIRSAVLVLGGVPACAALVVGFVWIGVASLSSGPKLPGRDWVQGSSFVGLSVLMLAFSARASLRVWRGQDGGSALPTVAKLVPLLALVGACGGALFGRSISDQRFTRHAERLAEFCEEAALWSMQPAQCVTKAKQCDTDAQLQPEKVQALERVLRERISSIDAAVTAAIRAGDYGTEGTLNQQRRHYERLHDLVGHADRADDARVLTCLLSDRP